jgi:hypothetical protein
MSWNGTSEHMSTMLKGFPDTLYIGMNAAVGFIKATLAQECALKFHGIASYLKLMP